MVEENIQLQAFKDALFVIFIFILVIGAIIWEYNYLKTPYVCPKIENEDYILKEDCSNVGKNI